MAITDRKLFRNPRPARDTLNRMGGIMASSAPLMNQVQRFQYGGGVSANQSAINQAFAASPALAQRMAMIEAGLSPLLSRVDSQTGDIQLGGSDIEAIAEGLAGGRAARVRPGPSFSDLNTRDTGISSLVPSTPATTVGGQVVQNILGGAAEGLDKGIAFVGDIGRSVIDPFSKLNPELAAAVAAGEAELPSEIVAGINSGEVPIPKSIAEAVLAGDITVSGLDLAKIEGFYDDPEEATVAEMMAAIPGQQTISVERPVSPETELGRDPGPVEADAAATTASSTGATASSAIPVPTPRPDNFAALVAASKAKTDEATAARETEEDRMRQGQLGTIQPRTPKEIADVINKGTKEEQDSELKQLMNEFTQNAPKYEGMDKGLAIAKIGFAMAAGKSPNAIQNIASALEDGADMFIKDKAKRDEFDRQVKLSAMQYGLTETGKLRAEDRRLSAELAKEGRKLNYFVADDDVTIGDRTYKKGQTVPITTEYIRDNGLPSSLTTTEMAKAALTATASYKKALATAKEKNIIDSKTYLSTVKDLNEATTDFVSANQLRQVVQGNVIRNAEGKITGVGPAFNQLVNNAFNAVKLDPGKEYENVSQFNQDMRRVSNLLLKDLLGEGSKNVSNIDRKLADEIVGLYSGYGGYAFQDPDLLNERLQNVLNTLENKERGALGIFKGAVESTEGMTFRSGKDVSLNIPSAARAALGQENVSGAPKYKLIDGVYRRVG